VHVASRSAGCQYCQAHSLVAAGLRGVTEERLAALWEYPTSPLYTEAERAALDFALAAGAVPNAVTADHFARLRQHWTDEQIVEMLAAVCLYGFLNRWNDTMATELEELPREVGKRYLGRIEAPAWRAPFVELETGLAAGERSEVGSGDRGA